MTAKRLTSREFNRDTGGAKKAALGGPVYITDRGRPSHVLLSFEDYQRLTESEESIVDMLSEPMGVENAYLRALDLNISVGPGAARPVGID